MVVTFLDFADPQIIEGRKPNYMTDLPVAFGAAVPASNITSTDKLHATGKSVI